METDHVTDIPQGDSNETVQKGLLAVKTETNSKENLVSGDCAEVPEKMADPVTLERPAEHSFDPAMYVHSLPKTMKRRLKALKKLQVQVNNLESEFFEELHDLECKYQAKYEPLYAKRGDIVNAKNEPTDEECEWSGTDEDPVSDKFETLAIDEQPAKEHNFDESTKGIPEFWLTIFRNVDILRSMVQPHDIPVLKHLQDIQVHLHGDKSFSLDFLFDENEFFTNKVLTKKYFLRFKPDEDEPIMYEGPEVYKCTGCQIDWKAGKNVTVRLVKKVQKHKGRGVKRVLTKTVQNDSFFNFFNPPTVTENETMDEETEDILEADFEIGQFLRERIVARAILYYTGECLDEDDDDEYVEAEEGEAAEDTEDDD